jgi:ABC-2 type transport system permease protein
MKRVFVQCIKELAQFQRDRLAVALAFFLPLAALLIYGLTIRLEIVDIPFSIQDFDRSTLSRSFIDSFQSTNQFKIHELSPNQSLQSSINTGKSKVAMIIPIDFSNHIVRDKLTFVQIFIDGTDSNSAKIIKNTLKATVESFLKAEKLYPVSPAGVVADTRILFNPGRSESLFIVSGAFAVVLWVYPSLISALAMIREKEANTLIQVYISDLSSTNFIMGKGLAYLLISLAQAIFIIVPGVVLFNLKFAGDPTPLIISTPIYLASSVLFGLYIGTKSSNQDSAVQSVNTGGFLTALLLSGFIYPLSNIPFPLSFISRLVPARYFIEICRDTFIRGSGWSSTWYVPLILLSINFLLFKSSCRHLNSLLLRK